MTLPAQNADMREGLLLRLGFLVGSLMLLLFPLSKPVWDDELTSILQGSPSYLAILAGSSDTQPPLHLLVLRVCETLAGGNLAVFRLASAFPAVVSLGYVYLLGRRITPQVGVLAVWLTALSPGLILFDRMARYHGLLAMLATMCVYYWLTALEHGRRRDLFAYGLTTFLMLMTYYLSLFVVIAQMLFFVLRRRGQPHLKAALFSVFAAVCAFLPWFIHGLLASSQHHTPVSHVEDPAMSLGVHGFLLRLGLPLYAFCFGETVAPWDWPVVVVGLIAVPIAFWRGGRWLFPRDDFLLVLVIFCVVVLSAAATSGSLGAFQTVGSMAKRVSFVLPLFSVIVSGGVLSLRSRLSRSLCLGALLMVSLYSVSNYWRDEQFLNKNYVARWDQAIALMKQRQWGRNTLVISCADPALHYYLERQSRPVLHVNAVGPSDINQVLTADHPRYLWLVGRDRGDRVAEADTELVSRQWRADYRRVDTFGLMPRSQAECYWLRRVLKRPAGPDYLRLELYDTQGRQIKPVFY